MRPLLDFAEDLQDRFKETLRVEEHYETSDGWSWQIRGTLIRCNPDAIAEITDYLQAHFPTDVGGDLEIDSVTTPLFPPVAGVFFVLNASDPVSSKVDVHLVDRFGRTRDSKVFSGNDSHHKLEGRAIPQAVIDAGLRQAKGTGDFVDATGAQVSPHDIEKFWAAAREA